MPANRPITLRDLLTFRLGLGAVMAPPDAYPIQKAMARGGRRPGAEPARRTAPDELMRRLGSLPLLHQPGERWLYHTGSDVLGVLIARASGQPLETFLRERIFEPLGMKDTGFSVPAAKLDRLATSYRTDPATGSARGLRRGPRRPVEPPARLRVRRRRAGLDGRRLSRLRPDDAEQGQARARAHPVAAFGRADDDRPADARAEGGCPASSPASGTAAAGASACPWSPGATTWRRCPDGSAGTAASARPGTRTRRRSWSAILMTQRLWTSPSPPRRLPRLLDLGLPGDRRLITQTKEVLYELR